MSSWDDVRKEYYRRLGASVTKALEGNGFKARYVETGNAAKEAILELIPPSASVGIPGSVTIRELGLPEALESRGHKIFHHWGVSLSPEERAKRLMDENASDVLLTSSNAVTLDGILVNIDGSGNRVSGMAWASNRIIFVVGINKVCRDVESAIQRIRDVATPMNAIRLNTNVPCKSVGHCVNCNSPERLCRALLILERVPTGRDAHVILVGEALGY